jgi:hypothetical protein
MTSQYTEARKRVEEAIARYATPGVASSGVVCCPDDLRLILALSAPPVTVEDVAEAIRENVGGLLVRETIEEAARVVHGLFTEGKT